VASLAPDDPVSGWTVDTGTAPEEFTGTVVGVLEGGIAPGIDMILVRLTSDEIDRVGGIWSGMSGSPVYDESDRLIGAVSYGLALGPSPVAGVTPAARMYELLDNPPAAGTEQPADKQAWAGADEVPLPRSLAEQLVESGDASTAEASSGLKRLPLPVAVSGLSDRGLDRLAKRLDLDNVSYYRSGSATGAAADPSVIVPGGNLAASLAYGDLSFGGVGTVTAVCGNEVLAFGHPAFWTGASAMTLHGADALMVQEDPTLTPFKVANITAPLGRITDDRMPGLRGALGPLPRGTTVRSYAEARGRSRSGRTVITYRDLVPDLTSSAHLANVDRVFDGISDGTARVRWVVRGTRPDGASFELVRTDRFASRWDITWESSFAPYSHLWQLQSWPRGRARIDEVRLQSFVWDRLAQYRIKAVQARQKGRWVNVQRKGLVRARRGGELKLRIVLASYQNLAGTARVRLDMPIPRRRAGITAPLRLVGGNSVSEWGGTQPATFSGLVTKLERQTRNDEIVASLGRRDDGRPWRVRSPLVWRVVGGSYALRVRLTR